MVQSQFSLSWDAYKSNICRGFCSLQQNGEFVDMTLAADGHFVKVHQMLMALVSPYLKDLITSAPCQHPVIFLNNVSYKTLSCLLEYVYTGEVLVPSENLMSFVETAKALRISGLENIHDSADTAYKVADNLSSMEDNIPCHITGIKSLSMPGNGSAKQIDLPAAAKKVIVRQKKTSQSYLPKQEISVISESNDMQDYSDAMDTTAPVDYDSDDNLDSSMPVTSQNSSINPDTASTNLQFTMSIRGSLQVILNRYIYNLHSSTQRAGVRRWRCVDYRNQRCKAFVVTKGSVVLNRANLHNHSFHDKKILQKIDKKAVFSALDDLEEYKQREDLLYKEAQVTPEETDYSAALASAMQEKN